MFEAAGNSGLGESEDFKLSFDTQSEYDAFVKGLVLGSGRRAHCFFRDTVREAAIYAQVEKN